jgi:hypothetical protein
VKDLECDQLLIDDETLYSGEATSGGSDFRCKQYRQLLSPIAVDSLMTTPEFKQSHSSFTVSSVKGGLLAAQADPKFISKPSYLFKINLKSAF